MNGKEWTEEVLPISCRIFRGCHAGRSAFEGTRRHGHATLSAELVIIITCCPSCEAQEPGDIEIIFVEGREHERVEACHKCRVCIAGIDLRNLAQEVVLEVAGFGLMHLDAIA